MSKGYWICAYRNVTDPSALAAYAELATSAVIDAGGRFIVRGVAQDTREQGIKERIGVVEFDSVERAIAAYESEAYQNAIAALRNTVERDFRIAHGIS
jgi:uncharacterized protein (DUF1330 family)